MKSRQAQQSVIPFVSAFESMSLSVDIGTDEPLLEKKCHRFDKVRAVPLKHDKTSYDYEGKRYWCEIHFMHLLFTALYNDGKTIVVND